jgi:hypothetical protein
MLVTEERELHHYNKSILINFKDLSKTSLQFAFPENCKSFPNIHKRRPSTSTSQVYNGFDDREIEKSNGRAEASVAISKDAMYFTIDTCETPSLLTITELLTSAHSNHKIPVTAHFLH